LCAQSAVHSSRKAKSPLQSGTTIYTELQMFRQGLFWAVNQGNHQNFEKSLLSYKYGLIFIGIMQNFFLKKKNQNGRLKKNAIFNSPNAQYFFMKIPWIGPWVSRVE
jgi:hypothetical protein